MPPAPIPADEDARLEALHRLDLLDSAPEQFFDDALNLLVDAVSAPFGAIAFIDEHRAWFKAVSGFTCTEVARSASIFAYAILDDDPLIIPDARQDPRLEDIIFAKEFDQGCAWASAPIRLETGHRIGAVCVCAPKVRTWPPAQVKQIERSARIIGLQLDARRAQLEKARAVFLERALVRAQSRYESLFNSVNDGVLILSREGVVIECNATACALLDVKPDALFGYRIDQPFDGRVMYDVHRNPMSAENTPAMIALRTGKPVMAQTCGIETESRDLRWLSITCLPMFAADGGGSNVVICLLQPLWRDSAIY